MEKLAAQREGSPSGTALMAERIQSLDWSRTPLGPISHWPPTLRMSLGLVLNTCAPMCLAWGDRLITVHNDACSPLFAGRREALGRPLPEAWVGDWSLMGPAVAQASAGQSCSLKDLPLVLERRGHPEHTWWTFCLSPVSDDAGRVQGILCVGHETTGEVEARATLPAGRERLARLFDQAPGFMAYLSGPNHVYQLSKQSKHSASDREVLGKSVREAFPELEGQGVFERLDEVYRTGKAVVETSRKMVFPDATGEHEFYFNQVLQPVLDDDGSVIGIFSVGQDVTDLVKAEAGLREREERLRLAVDAGRMAVWDVDVASGSVAASPELNRMLGLPVDAHPTLAEVLAQYVPGELDRLDKLGWEAQQRGDRFYETEYRHMRADDGEVRWFLLRAMRDFTEDGAIRRSFGVLMDVTERKEAEERLKLLALEVDHRANNLLATVQSVVTLTRAEDLPTFRESVLGRIDALAHAHRLLAEGRWTAARLARIAEEELRPFMAGSQVRIDGPDANLAPAVAQGVAIALHELVTNAVKYGALSRCEGRIDLTWTPPDRESFVHMTWLERGGPPARPPTRAGFGTNLLRRALAGAIGGSVELEWQADGLCCKLRVPVLRA